MFTKVPLKTLNTLFKILVDYFCVMISYSSSVHEKSSNFIFEIWMRIKFLDMEGELQRERKSIFE